jgi:Flp pilus assembly protein TadD
MNLGRGKRALADINHAIRLAEKDSETYLIRGMINLYTFRKNIEALQDYNLSLRLNPNDKDALFQRGYAYWKYGNLNYAEDDLKRAAALGSVEAQKMLQKKFRLSDTS